VKRREFITLLGGTAAAWPLVARAQQPAMPVVGYLNSATPEGFSSYLRALRQGLKESGYVESENLAIEYRWAEDQIDRLPALAADLVRRRVALIVAVAPPAALAAKAAGADRTVITAAPRRASATPLVSRRVQSFRRLRVQGSLYARGPPRRVAIPCPRRGAACHFRAPQ
jgi:putative ABC transport system substrate-binding protein